MIIFIDNAQMCHKFESSSDFLNKVEDGLDIQLGVAVCIEEIRGEIHIVPYNTEGEGTPVCVPLQKG